MKSFVYSSLLLAILAEASLCYAQTSVLPNKNACEFVSKTDAESILGTAVTLGTRNPAPTTCRYEGVGFTNSPPNNKQVQLTISLSNQPDPYEYASSKKGWSSWPYFQPGNVITDIPDFADAAFWDWSSKITGGTLLAFKGGTISVGVTVAGIPETPALRAAKALAAKVLGGATGTGYVYLGTPASDAAVAAKAKSAAAEAPRAPPAGHSSTSSVPASRENTPACQLISMSSLESILGVHFSASKSGPADPKIVSLIAPKIIASSSCQYSAVSGSVTVSVWYTEPFSPKIAKYDLLNYQEHLFAGGDDVTSHDFPYPAAFTDVDAGTYVFKDGANGLTILLINSSVPQDRFIAVDHLDGEKIYADRAKKIALEILGLPGPQQPLSAHAAGGIVHEPVAYWYAYRSDIIPQVVEGEFQSGWDSSSQFEEAFTTYVDMFSAHCRAYLPAHHVTMVVSQTKSKTDRYGNVISQQQLLSSTVEVDPRFAPTYQAYGESLPSSLGGLGNALGVASGRLSMDDILAAGNDMIKFFSIETCQSPVMHQLGENLLRAAKGELPVQETAQSPRSQRRH